MRQVAQQQAVGLGLIQHLFFACQLQWPVDGMKLQQQGVVHDLERCGRAAQVELVSACMRAQGQFVLDVAGAAGQRGLDRAEQLLGMAESKLQRMPDQVGTAQTKQVFSRRVEIGNARLVVQQDDCSGEIFQRREWSGLHDSLQSRNHAMQFARYLRFESSVWSALTFCSCEVTSSCAAFTFSSYLTTLR